MEPTFFETYVEPPLWMFGQSVLLLVLLLVFVAYILYADRKIFAAVQLRRGPTWLVLGGCCNRLRT